MKNTILATILSTSLLATASMAATNAAFHFDAGDVAPGTYTLKAEIVNISDSPSEPVGHLKIANGETIKKTDISDENGYPALINIRIFDANDQLITHINKLNYAGEVKDFCSFDSSDVKVSNADVAYGLVELKFHSNSLSQGFDCNKTNGYVW
jgi:hypothetical protein